MIHGDRAGRNTRICQDAKTSDDSEFLKNSESNRSIGTEATSMGDTGVGLDSPTNPEPNQSIGIERDMMKDTVLSNLVPPTDTEDKGKTGTVLPEEADMEINLVHSESCPVIFCLVGKIPLHAVVDTGATKTIISEEIYQKMNKPPPIVNTVKMKLAGKDQFLIAKQIGPVEIKLQNNIVIHRMVYVAPIQDQMLLGIDTLRFLKARLDAGEFKLEIGNVTLPLKHQNQVQTKGKQYQAREGMDNAVRRADEYRVSDSGEKEKFIPLVLKHHVLIPAGSEVVTEIHVKGSTGSPITWLEPNSKLLGMVGNSLRSNF